MAIFGAAIGFMAGAFIGGFVSVIITLLAPALNIFGLLAVVGIALYGAWLGWRMLPI